MANTSRDSKSEPRNVEGYTREVLHSYSARGHDPEPQYFRDGEKLYVVPRGEPSKNALDEWSDLQRAKLIRDGGDGPGGGWPPTGVEFTGGRFDNLTLEHSLWLTARIGDGDPRAFARWLRDRGPFRSFRWKVQGRAAVPDRGLVRMQDALLHVDIAKSTLFKAVQSGRIFSVRRRVNGRAAVLVRLSEVRKFKAQLDGRNTARLVQTVGLKSDDGLARLARRIKGKS